MDIGTQIALDAMFDLDSELITPYSSKGKVDITRYDTWYINIHTMIRNIIGDIPDKDTVIASASGKVTIYDILKVNVFNISSICSEHKMKVIFYTPDYKKVMKNGIIINKGKKADALIKILAYGDYCHERFKQEDITGNVLKDRSLRLPAGKTVVTTHFAIDLFNFKHHKVFDLLESHTGRLRTTRQFNKKYVSNSSVRPELYPFLEELLYLLGDGAMFAPVSITSRRFIQIAAEEQRWTTSTTYSRMRAMLVRDNEIKTVLGKIKKAF